MCKFDICMFIQYQLESWLENAILEHCLLEPWIRPWPINNAVVSTNSAKETPKFILFIIFINKNIRKYEREFHFLPSNEDARCEAVLMGGQMFQINLW